MVPTHSEANCFNNILYIQKFIYLFFSLINFYCQTLELKKIKGRDERLIQSNCLIWVGLGQRVDECHSPPCQGHEMEQIKRCLWKSIITIDKRSAVYLLWLTWRGRYTIPIHTLQIYTRRNMQRATLKCCHSAQIHFYLQVAFGEQFGKTAYCMCAFFSGSLIYVCVCMCERVLYLHMCVWLWGCAAVIITPVNTHMSTYWSLYWWAMKDLRLQKALQICLDFHQDHTTRSAQVQFQIPARDKLSALA